MALEVLERSMRYTPMSWEEYLELPESALVEWIDGVAVMAPPAVSGHQRATVNLVRLLERELPRLDVVAEIGIGVPRERVRIPDVSAFSTRVSDEDWLVESPPVLVAEVLSPSTRREDLIRKNEEYREAGISQYWVVDREARSIEVLSHGGTRWESVAVVDDAHPRSEVAVGEWGAVALDVREVLGDVPDGWVAT